jgi:hypothetical protein
VLETTYVPVRVTFDQNTIRCGHSFSSCDHDAIQARDKKALTGSFDNRKALLCGRGAAELR